MQNRLFFVVTTRKIDDIPRSGIHLVIVTKLIKLTERILVAIFTGKGGVDGTDKC